MRGRETRRDEVVGSFSLLLAPFSSGEPLRRPAVVLADLDHAGENVIPRLLLLHDLVREHATVPADVLHLLGDLAAAVAEPVSGVAGDVQLALRIADLAVAAG